MTASESIIVILFSTSMEIVILYVWSDLSFWRKRLFAWSLYSQVAPTIDYHVSLTLFNCVFVLNSQRQRCKCQFFFPHLIFHQILLLSLQVTPLFSSMSPLYSHLQQCSVFGSLLFILLRSHLRGRLYI